MEVMDVNLECVHWKALEVQQLGGIATFYSV